LGQFSSAGVREYLSAAYADSTWRKFDSAVKSFSCFEKYSNVTTSWPLSEKILMDYAVWAFKTAKVKGATVEAYLHLLKGVHKLKNLDTRGFDSYALKALIKGKQNLEVYDSEAKATRKVMTLALLKLLGHAIAKSGWSDNSKLVVWGAATVAFFGSLRCGEILPQNEKSFNPSDTLLWKDVKIFDDDHVLLHIKCTKNKTRGGEFVDIFGFEGHGVCPVKALKKLSVSS